MKNMRRFSFACALILCTGSCAFGEIDFNRQIRPILSQSCFACHGLDAPKSDLRLDFAEFAYKGGKSGRSAIVPGKPGESELMLRVTAHGEDRMPSKGDALSDDQISLLRQWIKEGARYAKHWAYEKPVRPKVPFAQNQSFIRNPIDSFVLQNLKEHAAGPRANLRTRPVGCAESAWA